GVPGSGLALFKLIAVYLEHHGTLAATVWGAMLRVLEATDLDPYPDLASDLKQKFEAYMRSSDERTRSSMAEIAQSGQAMPKETFDGHASEVRAKYHTEIELYCRRTEAQRTRDDRRASTPAPVSTEQVAIHILEALKAEWEHEPSLL